MLELIDAKDDLNCLEEIMELIYEEWGRYFSSSKESKLMKIKNSILEGNKLPKIYVLKKDKEVIGSFTIKENDLKGSDLTPWLACVVIKKEYRGKGYGMVLLDGIKKVIDSNYDNMYLLTSLNNFYEKIGFAYIKDINRDGEIDKLYGYRR